jgi:hypothetical protein
VSELDGYPNAHGQLKRRAGRAVTRLLVAVLAAAGVVAATAGVARAQTAISNWSNSPVRHPVRLAPR